jgi:hypothetical protein
MPNNHVYMLYKIDSENKDMKTLLLFFFKKKHNLYQCIYFKYEGTSLGSKVSGRR